MQKILRHNTRELNVKIDVPQPPFLPDFAEQIQVILEEKISICSFTFGIPTAEYVSKLKEAKVILMGTATQLIEAKMLEESGIDICVAQGTEAGGHRGTFINNYSDGLIGLMALVPQLVDHLQIPVVAAGGIMDIRGIKAAFALGAAGVQMGTAFLSCPESGAHEKFKEILLQTKMDNTTLTKTFSGKLVRAIKNRYISRMEKFDHEILDYPIQNTITRSIRKEAEKRNNTDFMAMWAGQAAYLSQGISVAELIAKLDKEIQS
jgi:nitronate monooxygenase